MGYYQGDFYGAGSRPGYYRGDPGFFSFIGGLAKKAAGFLPGPAGGIASGLLSKVGTHPTQMITAGRAIVKRGTAIVAKHPVLTAAGAAGAVGVAGGLAAGRGMRGVPGAMGMRHRRMRVTNPKALRRAIRRTQGFAKLAMRTIHLVHPRKKVRFGGFKKRTRKAV